jgi:hypothetical protein
MNYLDHHSFQEWFFLRKDSGSHLNNVDYVHTFPLLVTKEFVLQTGMSALRESTRSRDLKWAGNVAKILFFLWH